VTEILASILPQHTTRELRAVDLHCSLVIYITLLTNFIDRRLEKGSKVVVTSFGTLHHWRLSAPHPSPTSLSNHAL